MIKYRREIERKLHLEGKIKHWSYEAIKLSWVDENGQDHIYTPDFISPDRKKVLEVKGYFRKGDRTKYRLIKEQNPSYTFIFAFEGPSRRIKGTTISYGEWCKRNGFQCLSWEQILS